MAPHVKAMCTVLLGVASLVQVQAVCTAGQLDTTFGGIKAAGYVQVSPMIFAATNANSEGLVVDATGSIWSADTVGSDSLGNTTYGLVKSARGGIRDASLGGFGYIAPFGQIANGSSNLLIDAGGNVLMETSGATGVTLFRYASDGTPDTGFGVSGMATVGYTSSWFGISAVAQQPSDGKYLVVTTANNPSATVPNQVQPVVTRFNADGSVDTAFGSGGLSYLFPASVADPTAFGRGTDVVALANGLILVTGRIKLSQSGYFVPFIARLLANGALDTTFGTNGGFSVVDLGRWAVGRRLAIQPDGKIVVVGGIVDASTGYNDVAALRFNADGTQDTTFGTNGLSIAPLGYGTFGYSVALQDNGKIVIGSLEYLDAAQATTAGLVIRLTTSGQLDSAFGNGGYATVVAPDGMPVSGDEVALDGAHKIIYKINYNNPAPRVDGASYLVRIDTGIGKGCH